MSYLLLPFFIILIATIPSVILYCAMTKIIGFDRNAAESLAVIIWIGLIIYLAQ